MSSDGAKYFAMIVKFFHNAKVRHFFGTGKFCGNKITAWVAKATRIHRKGNGLRFTSLGKSWGLGCQPDDALCDDGGLCNRVRMTTLNMPYVSEGVGRELVWHHFLSSLPKRYFLRNGETRRMLETSRQKATTNRDVSMERVKFSTKVCLCASKNSPTSGRFGMRK